MHPFIQEGPEAQNIQNCWFDTNLKHSRCYKVKVWKHADISNLCL